MGLDVQNQSSIPGKGSSSFHHVVRTGSGIHPASCKMSNVSSFRRGRRAGTWRWPLTSIFAEV